MEIITQGYLVPEGEAESLVAVSDARKFMASNPPKRPVTRQVEQTSAVANMQGKTVTADAALKKEQEEPKVSAQALGYPLLLMQFAENPTLKFIIPVQLSYISLIAAQRAQYGAQPRGAISLATFLPYRGWGKWSYSDACDNATPSKKRKRGEQGDLPTRDKDFKLGGFNIAPGPVEQLLITFTGVPEIEGKAVEAIVQKIEETTGTAKVPTVAIVDTPSVDEAIPTITEAETVPVALSTGETCPNGQAEVSVAGKQSVSAEVLPEVEPLVGTSSVEPAALIEEESGRRSQRPVKRVKWNLDGSINEASAGSQAAETGIDMDDNDDDPTKSLRARIFCRLVCICGTERI